MARTTSNNSRFSIHAALANRQLWQISAHELTASRLMERNRYGDAAIHEAISSRQLAHIPITSTSSEVLSIRDSKGRNAICIAANIMALDDIPFFQTYKNLKGRFYVEFFLH